ncbi:hypothetical protein [Bartonella sp. TP]|uniref:hypothetical protein n=1 Tax=Bartonella sp. TP TaxID=3057550 RepID=UPI0025B19493|nr:hypothetical protein [Bartonella sp. TP]WJW80364.1 hypothetical protein QVL57_02025 [Bartonella sp. TP]
MQIILIVTAAMLALLSTLETGAVALAKHNHHKVPVNMARSVIFRPSFSWSGGYLGVQGSNDSS